MKGNLREMESFLGYEKLFLDDNGHWLELLAGQSPFEAIFLSNFSLISFPRKGTEELVAFTLAFFVFTVSHC